ncbi:MAG TPA: phenylacetate--CoA ligase family protein [Candidatus Binatia bacterium]|nr:phenylacetate--CoA ligase family protein [Candidatus Binatia bacterium]
MVREEQTQRALVALQAFLSTPLEIVLSRHAATSPEQAVLDLFRSVVAVVPAYRAFLAEQGIDPTTIQSLADFHALPQTTKKNYFLRYPLPDLCRNGRVETCDMIAVSSGSTGQPTFWPRFLADEFQIAPRFEQVFHDSFGADTRRTLAVVCFALGTWVGGMYTASCCRHLAAKGYPITVITPGNNKEEIFRVVTELGEAFEQVVLLGYPPFLKDIIDGGVARGIAWNRYKIKLVMAGEVFSEEWRTLVGERMGCTNHCYDSASLYGTADGGVLANETPLSICIRRFLAGHPDAARALFGESRLPTLAQYDPLSRFFETDGRSLLFSGDNGVPLVRYNILDTGGLIPYEKMMAFLSEWGFDPLAELHQYGERGMRPLPFVYVFGRSDFTVSYFGANIYPENVTVGLEQSEVSGWVTGKFVLEAKEDTDQNRFLFVTVELAPGAEGTEEQKQTIAASILAQLMRLNSEFVNYVPTDYRMVQVALRPTGDPEYFQIGVKHRYTRKS